MSVLAIIAALVIEQWQPLGERKAVQGALAGWAAWLEQQFNGGERRHGVVAWLVAVLPWVAAAIALEATLSFLGLGLPITEPSLGLLIANGYQYLLSGKYWISFFPGLALLLTIVSINLVADQLRDVLNPRLQR